MFVKDHENVSDERVRMRYGYLEAWVSIVGNVVIALINFFFGVTLNSIALIAQSVHTASDVVTSVVVLIGFKVAAQPADEKHPYGHGRVETIATLIIAILLLIVGFEFAGKAISRMIHGAEVKGNIPVVLVLLGVGAAKEWMARFATKLGRAINSSTLEADAWHHRSDAIASVLVSASIVSALLGYPALDAVFGLIVSILILHTGGSLAISSASVLIGEGADKETEQRITQIAQSIDGIRNVHNLNVHCYGNVKIVSLDIHVDPQLSVDASHQIANTLEGALLEKLSMQCVVHVEPDVKPNRNWGLEKKLVEG
jgi:cation diffusion facilitator family transporter